MYYAFFDVDETLITFKSMSSFLKYFYKIKYGSIGIILYYKFTILMRLFHYIGVKREKLNKNYYKKYKGYFEEEIKCIGSRWFSEYKNKNFYNEPILKELYRHLDSGAKIVLVSGSFSPCLIPIANDLGIEHVLCTNLEIIQGKYTGNIIENPIIGKGKSYAIRKFLEDKKADSFSEYFAYGDHISDLYMLSIVGKPYIISGDIRLEKIALDKGWKIIKK
ncbi:MAG: HAD-IB family hydrolase [Silvanigrellaceae bacterium]|nr:HAD-IB family hydrolase [Silvanigrellaceae bacterium]